jgi:hypothetical protein
MWGQSTTSGIPIEAIAANAERGAAINPRQVPLEPGRRLRSAPLHLRNACSASRSSTDSLTAPPPKVAKDQDYEVSYLDHELGISSEQARALIERFGGQSAENLRGC